MRSLETTSFKEKPISNSSVPTSTQGISGGSLGFSNGDCCCMVCELKRVISSIFIEKLLKWRLSNSILFIGCASFQQLALWIVSIYRIGGLEQATVTSVKKAPTKGTEYQE